MKKLLALLLFPMFCSAQNWSLINPEYKYNYSPNSLGYVNTVTVHVDSLNVTGTDSIFYLNRILGTYNTDTVIRNTPQFLQRKMIKKITGEVLFQDTASYIIKPLSNTGDSWTFDSVNSITAQIIGADTLSILGNNDSVKYVLLSSSDTIVISQNYGLISWSTSYQNSNKYRLAGIEGLNVGLQTPGFWDVYNINVGDVFEYHSGDSHFCPSYSCQSYTNNFYKFTILSKQINGHTITFNLSTLRKKENYTFWTGYQVTYYTPYTSGLFIDSLNNYPSLIQDNNEALVSGNYYKKLSLYTDNVLLADGKSVSGEYWYVGPDTIPAQWPPFHLFDYKFAAARGLVKYHTTDYQQFNTSDSHDSTLTGCIVNGITYGTIHTDSFFIVGIGEIKAQVNLVMSPNPAHGKLNVECNLPNGSTGSPTAELKIYDMTGREVYSTTLNAKHETLNLSLSPALYFVRVASSTSATTQKLIIE